MDRSNLQQVNMLYAEARSIDLALQGLDQGGGIVEMSVSMGPIPEDEEGRRSISGIPVRTTYMTPPPQMIESVKALMTARKAAIDAELQSLGLTG